LKKEKYLLILSVKRTSKNVSKLKNLNKFFFFLQYVNGSAIYASKWTK